MISLTKAEILSLEIGSYDGRSDRDTYVGYELIIERSLDKKVTLAQR